MLMTQISERNIRRPLAIFAFGELLSAPVVQSVIGHEAEISAMRAQLTPIVAALNAAIACNPAPAPG